MAKCRGCGRRLKKHADNKRYCRTHGYRRLWHFPVFRGENFFPDLVVIMIDPAGNPEPACRERYEAALKRHNEAISGCDLVSSVPQERPLSKAFAVEVTSTIAVGLEGNRGEPWNGSDEGSPPTLSGDQHERYRAAAHRRRRDASLPPLSAIEW